MFCIPNLPELFIELANDRVQNQGYFAHYTEAFSRAKKMEIIYII